MAGQDKTVIRAAVILSGLMLVLALAMVWLNNERAHLGYEMTDMKRKFAETRALTNKLKVERDNLLSPYYLREKAEEYGLRPAEQGQIRHVGESEPDAG